jgi:hypothetical protein
METRNKLEEFFSNTPALEAAARDAVREAVRRHKLLGESIVIWRDGKVVVVPPEEIEVEPVEKNGSASH